MTVPGGVPNLPVGALTLETLAVRLQDQTAGAIRNLASARLPSIFDASTGGTILSDLSPFGIITRIWAEVVSAIATADPADITGPEDLPGLLLDFIEELPVIGELVGLLEAIGGFYTGDDATLIAVQEIFFPIRKLLQLVSGQPVGWPTLEEVTVGWVDLGDAVLLSTTNLANFLAATGQATFAALGDALADLIDFLTAIPANLLSGALPTTVTLSGTQLGTLLQYLNSSGQYAAAQLTGALNTGLTFSGTALSVLLQYLNGSGQFNAAQLTGGINTAVTIGGQAVSSIFNGTGQFIGVLNATATGALNTAVTVGGTAIGTAVINANSAVTNINSLISNVSGTGIADVNTFINAASTNAQGSLNAIVNGVNNSAVTGQTVTQAQTAVNNFVSGVVNNLQGIAGTFGLTGTTSANSAFAAAAAAAAAQSAALTAQQSAFNAVFNVSPASAGNINVTVDFSTMANAANMSGVMSPGSTALGITSGAAALQSSATSFPGVFEVFPTQTVSDYQVATATFGPLNQVLTTTGFTFLTCRCNSARDTFVAVEINNNALGAVRLYLTTFVSGTRTILSQTDLASTPSTGNTLRLVVGDPNSSSPYAMQVLVQGTPVITYTDSSHVSQLGASYRYVGLGQRGTTSARSVDFRAVSYQDNPPASASYPFSGTPTAGTKGRMYVSNDVGLIQRDNGTAWEYVWGGPLGYFTKPPSTSWSWVNQGTASVLTELGGEAITAPTGTRNWRLRVRTLTPASNYTATCYLEASGAIVTSTNRWHSGIVLRNSTSGSFISFGPSLYSSTATGSTLTIYRWTSATVFSALSFEQSVYTIHGSAVPNWYRIRDDGTNRYFEYSVNGVDWITVLSESRTAFITPGQIGFGADNEGSGSDMKIRLRSFAGVS